MAKDHYITAAHMGSFSHEQDGPTRERQLWVARRNQRKPHPTSGSRIGFANNLYSLIERPEDRSVDQTWTDFEGALGSAVDALCDPTQPLDANVWLRTLVPFVASMFVRGLEFDGRFRRRFAAVPRLADYLTKDQVNNARIIELQRLLAPVTAARWIVLTRTNKSSPFISNELGLAGCFDSKTRVRGWSIPLDQGHVLLIYPSEKRRVLTIHERRWVALIEHHRYINNQVQYMNRSLTLAAQEFIFGPTRESVQGPSIFFDRDAVPTEVTMGGWPFPKKVLAAHEFDWYRLASIATRDIHPGTNELDLQGVDWSAITQSWSPRTYFPTNLPWFRSGLDYADGFIELELSPRTGFPGDPDYPEELNRSRIGTEND